MLSNEDVFNKLKDNLDDINKLEVLDDKKIKYTDLGGILFLFKESKNKSSCKLRIQIITNQSSIHIFTNKYEYSYYNYNNTFDVDLIDRINKDIVTLISFSPNNKILVDKLYFDEAFYDTKNPIFNL